MNLPQMNKTAAILLTCLLSMVAIMPQVEAAPPKPKVTSVELDLDAGKMVVTGRNFGTRKWQIGVLLHLAETGPVTLNVDSFTKLQPTEEVPVLLHQLVVSGLPQNIDDFAGMHLLEVRRKYKQLVNGVSVVKYKIGTRTVTIGAQGVGVSQTTIDAEGNLIVTLTNGTEINAGQVKDTSVVLELSKQSELFDYTGGTGSINIQSNADWEWEIEGAYSTSGQWITQSSLDFGLQNGNQTLTYEVAPLPLESNEPREASIIFTSTNGPRYEWYFTVRQEPRQ